MSDGTETWWKAMGQHRDLELLKWFRSDIQDDHHGSHLQNLQITMLLKSDLNLLYDLTVTDLRHRQ